MTAGAQADEARRCRRFGWTWLAAWSIFGLSLEAAHGFKLSVFLDDQLRHTLLRLAHAHGVVLALVVLAFGGGVAALYGDAPPAAARRTGRLIRIGAAIVPLGFALSAIAARGRSGRRRLAGPRRGARADRWVGPGRRPRLDRGLSRVDRIRLTAGSRLRP